MNQLIIPATRHTAYKLMLIVIIRGCRASQQLQYQLNLNKRNVTNVH